MPTTASSSRRPAKDAPPAAGVFVPPGLRHDPLGFARWAFAWGDGPLKGRDLEPWQADALAAIGDAVTARGFDGGRAVDPVRLAVASGHGVGKSALVAWLILWILSTRPHASGTITANTEAQLRTKTWGELARWLRRSKVAPLFKVTTGAANLSIRHVQARDTWGAVAQTCAKENSEAFAGQHNAASTSFYIFDEASAVPDVIWEVAEGGLTDGEPMFFVFGNPTRNTGRFRECFGKARHRWLTRRVDSRSVGLTNKGLIQGWIEDYGEDSDFVRVRVKGEFPRAASLQFITEETVAQATAREPSATLADPLILGVDVARFGDDASVLFFRRGRDARTIPPVRLRGVDTMTLAPRVAEAIRAHGVDAVFVDGGGVGGGVVDRLRQLGHEVMEVQFGGAPDRAGPSAEARGERYANKRAEMWGALRAWLAVGAVPDDPDLRTDLTGVEYGYTARDEIILEKKERMKERGLASPDLADALALTFAWHVAPRERRGTSGLIAEYDPYAPPG